jgi:hypothetical protein
LVHLPDLPAKGRARLVAGEGASETPAKKILWSGANVSENGRTFTRSIAD